MTIRDAATSLRRESQNSRYDVVDRSVEQTGTGSTNGVNGEHEA